MCVGWRGNPSRSPMARTDSHKPGNAAQEPNLCAPFGSTGAERLAGRLAAGQGDAPVIHLARGDAGRYRPVPGGLSSFHRAMNATAASTEASVMFRPRSTLASAGSRSPQTPVVDI